MADLSRKLPEDKERQIPDLVRIVGTRVESVPNFALLLGAGASVTSGIHSGESLVEEWRRVLFQRLCPTEPYEPEAAKACLARHYPDYSVDNEYAGLIGHIYDLPVQRRMFVEQLVAGRSPGLGYGYTVGLMAASFVNPVYTTNFDDLLNEAFHTFSDLRPLVCAHDSAIGSVMAHSGRPTIVKLHGDYFYNALRSTSRETEALDRNMENKLTEFSRNRGLIVAGYGGHDRSVMSLLNRLLGEADCFPLGIYWCVYGTQPPSERLRELLQKERTYWVRIPGFDELMAELYGGCVGTSLPFETSRVSDRPRAIVTRICSDANLARSSSPRIQRDLAKLAESSQREDLIHAIRLLANERNLRGPFGLSDDQILRLHTIRRMIEDREFAAALKRIESEFGKAAVAAFQTELQRLRLLARQHSGDRRAAVEACDNLLAEDPNEVTYLISRSRNETPFEKKLESVHIALERDPYSAAAFLYRGELNQQRLFWDPACDVSSTGHSIASDYERALEIDPGFTNGAWAKYALFLASRQCPLPDASDRIARLLEELARRGPRGCTYLTMLVDTSALGLASAPRPDELIEWIRESIATRPRARKRAVELLLLKTLLKFGRHEELSREVAGFDAEPMWNLDDEYLQLRADIHLQSDGNATKAVNVVKRSRAFHSDQGLVQKAVGWLCLLGRADDAHRELNEHAHLFEAGSLEELRSRVHDAAGKPEACLQAIRRAIPYCLFPAQLVVDETHALLKLGKNAEAEQVARNVLVPSEDSRRFEELIINHQIAVSRQDRALDKALLLQVLHRSASDRLVCLCAQYLLGNHAAAADCIVREFQSDRSVFSYLTEWTLFDTPDARAWLTRVARDLGVRLEDPPNMRRVMRVV